MGICLGEICKDPLYSSLEEPTCLSSLLACTLSFDASTSVLADGCQLTLQPASAVIKLLAPCTSSLGHVHIRLKVVSHCHTMLLVWYW